MTEMRKKKGYRIRKLGKAAISLILSLALSACGGNTPAIQSGGTESTAETLLSTEAEPASETELESLPVLTIESEGGRNHLTTTHLEVHGMLVIVT